jgi:hypothetical protein
MFVRTLTVPSGKHTYRYLKLVENRRVNGRTVQDTILNLGNVDKWTDERLEQAISKLAEFAQLPWSRLEEVRVGQAQQLGPYLALDRLWDELRMDDIITRNLSGRGVEIPVAQYVRAMVFHRLVDPGSKLELHRSMEQRMLVPGLEPSDLPLHGYYRSLEYLDSVKRPVEKCVHSRLSNLFNRDVSLVFYDLTSTYFEGHGCSIACRGYSRDHRGDLLQVQLGLLVDGDGIPIGHEVFPGSMRDASTVVQALHGLERDFGVRRCVFVGDDCMSTEDNMREIAERGYEYITSLTLRHSRIGAALLERLPPRRTFRSVLDNLSVMELDGFGDGIRYVASYNGERARANCRSRLRRLREALDGLRDLRERPGRRDVRARAADILKRTRCHRLVAVRSDDEGRLTWRLDRRAYSLERAQDGLTILRTNSASLDAEQIALSYRRLWIVENAFRHLKDPICLRPIRHWKDPRVFGHIFVCVLAYMLERLLEMRLREAGVARTARAALDDLADLSVVTLQVAGRTVRRRSEITPSQMTTLAALGIRSVPEIW